MRRQFIPIYDTKIRGGEHIIQWRYGAHPTIHAFTSIKENRKINEATNSNSFPVHQRGRIGRAKGALWADANTAPAPKFSSRKNKSDSNEFKITETEDIALRNEVRRALQDVKRRHMRAILPKTRALDKFEKGTITYDKVKEILQSNQISLSELGFRNLGRKFGEKEKEHHVVRYEKLISYLTKLWSEAAVLPKNKPSTPPAAGFSNTEDRITGGTSYTNRGIYTGADNRIVNMRNRVLFRDTDESQMLADLEIELSANEGANLVDLRRIMYNFDRDRNNFLNEGQVYASFQKCGVNLSPEVFQQLLMATDRTGAGAYNIETLINYLVRVRPELQYYLLLGENYAPRRARVPVHPNLYNQPMFATPGHSYSSALPEYEDESEIPEEYESPVEDDDDDDGDDDDEDERFDPVKWRRDYRFVEEALHHADVDRAGFLPEKEVRHIASNYISVYNLGITKTSLNTALNRAFDSSFNEINLDQFIGYLEQLHFSSIQNDD